MPVLIAALLREHEAHVVLEEGGVQSWDLGAHSEDGRAGL